MKQSITSQRIELTKHVVEEQEWIDTPGLLHEFVTGESKGERERALLSLRGLSSSVTTVERDRDVVTLRAECRVAAKTVIIERSLQRVVQTPRPRLFILECDDLLVVSE